jgi:hypothetical protein
MVLKATNKNPTTGADILVVIPDRVDVLVRDLIRSAYETQTVAANEVITEDDIEFFDVMDNSDKFYGIMCWQLPRDYDYHDAAYTYLGSDVNVTIQITVKDSQNGVYPPSLFKLARHILDILSANRFGLSLEGIQELIITKDEYSNNFTKPDYFTYFIQVYCRITQVESA